MFFVYAIHKLKELKSFHKLYGSFLLETFSLVTKSERKKKAILFDFPA